jgi:hypothetical protein
VSIRALWEQSRPPHELTQYLAKSSLSPILILACLEIGMHDPSLSALAKLAKALRVDVADLVRNHHER